MKSPYADINLIFVLSLVATSTVANPLSCNRDELIINLVGVDTALDVTPYHIQQATQETDCHTLCLYNERCLSFNIKLAGASTLECELFRITSGNNGKWVKQIGYKHFQVHSDHRCLLMTPEYPHLCDCRAVPRKMQDCAQWREEGAQESGLYIIDINGRDVEVFCEMEIDGGGWTVFQNRIDGSVDFNRNWNDYKIGFGNLTTEFWLGNDYLHKLTQSGDTTLCIKSTDMNNFTQYSILTNFNIAGEATQYSVSYSNLSGPDLEDTTARSFNGKKFSTFDNDNDIYRNVNCVERFEAGFWFSACITANLNGPYTFLAFRNELYGLFWAKWNKPNDFNRYDMATVSMMVRRNLRI